MGIEQNRRRGAALTAALVVVVTIAGLGAYLIQMQAAMARRQALSIDTRTALYTAEAGLAEAAYQVSQGRSGEIGSSNAPAEYNGNKYWVEAEEMPDGQISLTSTAIAGHSRFRVNLAMVPNVNPAASLGIFGVEGVRIGDRVLIDGYDASQGIYPAFLRAALDFPTTGAGALVGSNGDVVIDDGLGGADQLVARVDWALAGPLSSRTRADLFAKTDPLLEKRYDVGLGGLFPQHTMIAGEIRAGVGAAVLQSPATRIAEIAERKAEAVLPEVIVPASLPVIDPGDRHVATNETWAGKAGTIDQLIVGAGVQLRLEGPLVLQVRACTIEEGAWVIIDDVEGPVTIYCTESFHAQDGSVISMTAETEKHHGFSLLAPPPIDPANDNQIKIKCLGDIRGIIYTPGHALVLEAGLRIYGSVVAKHLTLEDDVWLTVDSSLRIGGAGFPSLPKKRRWTAVSATDDSVLTATASVATSPEDALPEQVLEVLYLDANEDKATYSGHISLFDPSVAQRILSVRWQDPDTLEFSDWMMPAGASPDRIIERWRDRLREARDAETL